MESGEGENPHSMKNLPLKKIQQGAVYTAQVQEHVTSTGTVVAQ